MGLVTKDGKAGAPTPGVDVQEQLTPQEIEFILTLIKQATFRGEHIETLYNLVMKLQKNYVLQTQK